MMALRFALAPVLAAGFLVLLPGTGRSGTTCPTNSIDTGRCFETSTAPSTNWSCGDGYNLVAGTMTSSSGGGGEGGSFQQQLVHDLYRIVGPATAQPISFVVKLHAIGIARGGLVTLPFAGKFCSTSEGTLRLISGALSQQATVRSQSTPTCSGDVPIDVTLELALQHVLGEIFDVTYRADMNSGPMMSTDAQSVFWFEGLPPGYTIESCQGYAGPVVPAISRSWGMLKHSYR